MMTAQDRRAQDQEFWEDVGYMKALFGILIEHTAETGYFPKEESK